MEERKTAKLPEFKDGNVLNAKQLNLIVDSIKSIQYFIFWSILTWLSFYVLKQSKGNDIKFLSFLFLTGFFYTLTSFYFGKLVSYVTEDIIKNISKKYTKNKEKIKAILKGVGYSITGSLLIILLYYWIRFILINETAYKLFNIVGIILSVILAIVAILIAIIKKKSTLK